MCPELMMNKKYDAKKADVFSFGVIIFVFFKGCPPFQKADIYNDPYYKTLIKKPENYWKVMDKKEELTEDLKDLLIGCL